MTNICKKFLSIITILSSISIFAIDTDITTVGRNMLHIPGGIDVSIVNFNKHEKDGHLNWKAKLVVRKNNIVFAEKYPIMTNYDENYFYYFVPIKNGKYILDLDNDTNYEFAVVVDHGGNAPGTELSVFSLSGTSLSFFTNAWYQMEGGNEIIWKKENVPKKCLFVAPGICEYL